MDDINAKKQAATSSRGFVVLIGVLVISAIGLAIGVSAVLLGIGSSRTSLAIQERNEANALAHACAEKALQSLFNSIDYAGNESVTFTRGSCQILAVQGSGSTSPTVQTSGTVGQATRKVQVQVSNLYPQMTITSWQETDY